MKGYWRRSFYVFLCVGLLFSLVSCGSDDDNSTNTDLLVAFTIGDVGGPGSVQRYNGTTGASLGAFASAGLDVPTGLVFGPDGNLYVSSFNNNVVLRYSGRTGASIGIFASSNELSGPEQLVFGPDGDLYVASFNSNSVERFKGATGEPRRTFVTPGSGGLNGPTGVAFGRDGNLYVSSNTSGEVLRYDGGTGAFKSIFVPAGKLLFPAFLTFTP